MEEEPSNKKIIRYVVLALIILLALAFAKEAVRLWRGQDFYGHSHTHAPGESHKH